MMKNKLKISLPFHNQENKQKRKTKKEKTKKEKTKKEKTKKKKQKKKKQKKNRNIYIFSFLKNQKGRDIQ